MCGRTSLFVPQSVLEDRFDAEFVYEYIPRYNIAPSDDLTVIKNRSPDKIDLLEWGLIPSWVDDPEEVPTPINARAETVSEKPMFREAYKQRRCLVLADGFYEWKGERGQKQPYRVTKKDDAPFAMAGLWETWEGNGEEQDRETTTIITTEPNDVVSEIHDRMPVILAPDEEDLWLNQAGNGLDGLLDPFPSELMQAYPVSKAVNNPSNESPEVIEKIDG